MIDNQRQHGKSYGQIIALIKAVTRNLVSVMPIPDFEIWVVPKKRVEEYRQVRENARVRVRAVDAFIDDATEITEEHQKVIKRFYYEGK